MMFECSFHFETAWNHVASIWHLQDTSTAHSNVITLYGEIDDACRRVYTRSRW